MDLSKFQITHEIKWMDSFGRYVVLYKSAVYPIENVYLLPDDDLYHVGRLELRESIKDLLGLNFWFICFQYEGQLKDGKLKNNNQPPTAGQVTTTAETTTNAS